MSDQLFDGRSFRILTVIDVHTREALTPAFGEVQAHQDAMVGSLTSSVSSIRARVSSDM